MTKYCAIPLLTILVLLSSGYTFSSHWSTDTPDYYLYPGGFLDGTLSYEAGSGFNSDSQVIRLMKRASLSWSTYSGADIKILFHGTNPGSFSYFNGVNEVRAVHCGFLCDPRNCATTFRFAIAGVLQESDIEFLDNMLWTTQGTEFTYVDCHMHSAAIHEFGHFLGMEHPNNLNLSTVMNLIGKTTHNPGDDDINGIRNQYGASSRRICRACGYLNSSARFVMQSFAGCDVGSGPTEYTNVGVSLANNLTASEPDFLEAWTGTDRHINTRTGTTIYDGSYVAWNNKVTHGSSSAYAPDVAFGSSYSAVVFTGEDQYNFVNVRVAPNSQLGVPGAWTPTTFSLPSANASGSPSIAYSRWADRFIVVWNRRNTGFVYAIVSNQGPPYTWTPVVAQLLTFDSLTATYEPPSIDCRNRGGGSADSPECIVQIRPSTDYEYHISRMRYILSANGTLVFSSIWESNASSTLHEPAIAQYFTITTPPPFHLQGETQFGAWPLLSVDTGVNETSLLVTGTYVTWIVSAFPPGIAHGRWNNKIELAFHEGW